MIKRWCLLELSWTLPYFHNIILVAYNWSAETTKYCLFCCSKPSTSLRLSTWDAILRNGGANIKKNSKICQSKGCYRTAYEQRNWNFVLAHGWLSKGIFDSLNFTYTMIIQKILQKTEPLCRYTWSKSEDKDLNFGRGPHLNHSWVFMKQIPINHIKIHVGQTWELLSKWDPN